MRALAGLLAVVALGLAGCDSGSGDGSASNGLTEGEDWSYRDLSVVPSVDDRLDGTVEITNETDEPLELRVLVTAYAGPMDACPGPEVGELSGVTEIGPNATESVDLNSTDQWAKAPCLRLEVEQAS